MSFRAARPCPRRDIGATGGEQVCLHQAACFARRLPALATLTFALSSLSAPLLRAQEPPPTGPLNKESLQPLPEPKPASHRFWDARNAGLFAGVVGARALDYVSTRHLRNKGLNEILLSNDIVDNKPLFVAIEASGVALSIGVSYLFHKTGHHKLERWASVVHISVGTAGGIRNFVLKPDQPPVAPQ